MIRSRDVSCREAIVSALDCIAAVNPRINALAFVMADRADETLRRGEDVGELQGVSTTVKINTDQAGWPTTEGVRLFAETVGEEDSPQVASLEAVDAISVGRSNSPAFGLRWFTDNDLQGRKLNPWRAHMTPGGSSGGAAAAVATGMCAIGRGNDLGGSIRYRSTWRPGARVNFEFMFAGAGELDRDGYLAALARRLAIARA